MFDYDQLKEKQEAEGTQWASYSDLFMVLSVVFLLLYVTSSLRNGTFSIEKHLEMQKLAEEAADLKQQIKAYKTIGKNYLDQEASQKELNNYNELMSQLDLLQDQAKEERDQLNQQAKDLDSKQVALNKYQRMIRNIINANLNAKSRVSTRDVVIDEQKVEIDEKREEITKLEEDVQKKKEIISKNENKIESINNELDQKIQQLEANQKKYNTSKKILNTQIAKLKQNSKMKVEQLQAQNKVVDRQLKAMNSKLDETEKQLAQASAAYEQEKETRTELEGTLSQERQEFKSKLGSMASKYEQEIKKQEQAQDSQMESLRNQFASQLKAKNEQYQAKLDKQRSSSEKQLSSLSEKIKQKEMALASKDKEYQRQLAAEKEAKGSLKSQLAAAKEREMAKRKLADQIKKNFAKAGIKVDVNANNGDVVLSFGDEYFATGKSSLKPKMETILKKFMPIYSKSLFQQKKISEKISSVEIIGFSSPTYKGKYVDPASINEGDKRAVDYNLDLSYKRAKSIFSYIFDKKKMTYQHQKDLLPLVKVTGRSFFTSSKGKRKLASGASRKEFCKVYDCKKAQRVIIKFNLEN